MANITYVNADGSQRVVDVAPGTSVMQAAVSNGIAGILGDCGGACQCATCHVYIAEPWQFMLPPLGDMEDAMLECASAVRDGTSRLGCEVVVTEMMEGMVVRLPDTQI